MVNNERIVPIQSMDFLSMIGTVMALQGTSVTVVAASDVEGNFTAGTGNSLLNQPAKSIEFSGASATVYFVADYHFEGFSKTGATLTVTGDVVDDGITLNKAVLASGAVTVTQVTPAEPQA